MNRPLACLSLLSLILLLLALTPCQAQPSPPLTAPAPLNEADGYRFAFQYDPPRISYIIIQVSINGKPPLPFLLDTGTNVPVTIDKEAAREIGLPMTASKETGNQGRVLIARAATVKSVRLPGLVGEKSINFARTGAAVVDLTVVKEAMSPWVKVAGIIGASLLDQFTVRLDFPHKIMTIYLKPHPPVAVSGAEAIPLVEQRGKHRYFTQVCPGQGLSADLLLDTGSAETSLPLNVASQIASTPRYGNGSGTLGSYYVSQTLLLPKIRVGTSTLGGFAVGSSPTVAGCTLGIDLLSCFRVTLDFPHQQMFLEPAADRPYRLQGWAGFRLKTDGEDFRVKVVVSASPAEKAGLQVDDKILSIDGRMLHGLSLDAAGGLRNDFAGSRATLLLQRGDAKPFALSFVRANLFAAPPDIEMGLTVEKPDKQPISVIQVDAGSPAQRAGLVTGDTITAVNGAPSASMSADQTDDAFSQDGLTLTVQQAGEAKPRTIILAK